MFTKVVTTNGILNSELVFNLQSFFFRVFLFYFSTTFDFTNNYLFHSTYIFHGSRCYTISWQFYLRLVYGCCLGFHIYIGCRFEILLNHHLYFSVRNIVKYTCYSLIFCRIRQLDSGNVWLLFSVVFNYFFEGKIVYKIVVSEPANFYEILV